MVAAPEPDPLALWDDTVAAARSGNEEAFSRLIAAIWPELVAFARSVLGREADAEDVVQESLVIAWRRLPELKAPSRFRRWMWKIAYREALRQIAARPDAVPLEALRRSSIRLVKPDIDIPRLLAVLTPRQRAIVYLAFVDGWSCSQIGAVLGGSAITIRILQMRALARLRRHLGVKEP